MPCSCKASKTVTYVQPVSRVVVQKPVQQVQRIFQQPIQSDSISIPEIIPSSGQSYTKIFEGLDTGSTTKPDQLCFNCVRKHIGLAYMFAFRRDQLGFLTGMGQLLCAVQHLKQKFPNTAYMIRDGVLKLLRNPDISQAYIAIKELAQYLRKDLKQDLKEYIPLPSFTQEQELLAILLVNSLLFVQISYEQVNKTWATAALSFMAYNAFRSSNALKQYNTYRPLWKLIQSMEFMDSNYLAARDSVHSLMISKYPSYIQLEVPKRKAQFEQDYKKQKQMMKGLQKGTLKNI